MSDLSYKVQRIQIGVVTELAIEAGWGVASNHIQIRQGSLAIEDDRWMTFVLALWFRRSSATTTLFKVYDLTNTADVIEAVTLPTTGGNYGWRSTSVGALGTWPSGDAVLQLQYQSDVALYLDGAVLDIRRERP